MQNAKCSALNAPNLGNLGNLWKTVRCCDNQRLQASCTCLHRQGLTEDSKQEFLLVRRGTF